MLNKNNLLFNSSGEGVVLFTTYYPDVYIPSGFSYYLMYNNTQYRYPLQIYGNDPLILEVNIGDVITYNQKPTRYPEKVNGEWYATEYNDVIISGNTVTITGRKPYAYMAFD